MLGGYKMNMLFKTERIVIETSEKQNKKINIIILDKAYIVKDIQPL